MKYLTFLLLLSLVAVRCDGQDSDAEEQVKKAEAAVSKAIRAKDFATLETLWSPQMVVNSPANNILNRDEVFGALRAGYLEYSKYENVVEAFRAYGDVAVLMGHEVLVRADGAYGSKTLNRRYTDIWQRTGTSWVQVARQATYTSTE